MTDNWMIYGANGYTGELVARLAVARGERPVLAGRSAEPVARLARELGLDHVAFDLADAAAHLGAVAVVAHCAGPFHATAAPMVDACLATGTHYLDITGEIAVFEALHARRAEAAAAGVALLPGAGFDVVPTDCLAAMLHARLPGATSLELAFVAGGGFSRGTARTALSGGGVMWRRVEGRLVPVTGGAVTRSVPLPSGARTVSAIPWGDLATAYRSTGIPNITTYTALPAAAGVGPALLKLPWARSVADRLVRTTMTGPSAATRARTRTEVWGEVRDPDGRTATDTLVTPNAYDLTADAVLRAVPRMAGLAPGFHTPSTAFGAGFVLELDGVTLGSAPTA
ncbi:saccharopine dehydrogenase NADP-binding domain-containing protein [Longispora sp. NPDC051575]|uniref:saccharopine dehydrogenase family protein n=1 Tax=Longispora sp. NPDC051575 TaxID=3154943 RepID=UPI00343435C1